MSGDTIEAGQAQGVINKPQGPVNLNWGDTNSAGKDLAGRDVNKNTVINILVSPESNRTNLITQVLQQLEPLLNKADSSQITQAFYDSLPPGFSVSRQNPNDLGTSIQQLQDFKALEKFSKKLEDILSNKPMKKIQACLLVVLYPPSFDEFCLKADQFCLKAWLIPDVSSPEACEPLVVENQQSEDSQAKLKDPYSYLVQNFLEEFPRFFEIVLRNSTKLLKYQSELVVELFLPASCLGFAVDQLKVLAKRTFGPIGNKYPFIVRSVERLQWLQDNEYVNDWRNKWDTLQEALNKIPDESAFLHLDQLDGCNWDGVIDRFLAQKEKIGIQVSCPPSEAAQEELFDTIIKAATPIAIWIRRDISGLNSIEKIKELLAAGPLFELPKSIYQRRASPPNGEHIYCDLSLLWEDPNRLPPDINASLVFGQ